MGRREGRDQGAAAKPSAPLHHLAPPAGSLPEALVQPQADDGDRPAPVRGRRARRRGARRPHHLHAHRLDPDLPGSSGARSRLHLGALRGRLPARRAAGLPVAEARTGRARGDPADLDGAQPGARRAVPRAGRAQALHPRLEPLPREPDGAGDLRPDRGRHPGRRVPLPGQRPGNEVRRLHPRLHRGRRRPRERPMRAARATTTGSSPRSPPGTSSRCAVSSTSSTSPSRRPGSTRRRSSRSSRRTASAARRPTRASSGRSSRRSTSSRTTAGGSRRPSSACW